MLKGFAIEIKTPLSGSVPRFVNTISANPKDRSHRNVSQPKALPSYKSSSPAPNAFRVRIFHSMTTRSAIHGVKRKCMAGCCAGVCQRIVAECSGSIQEESWLHNSSSAGPPYDSLLLTSIPAGERDIKLCKYNYLACQLAHNVIYTDLSLSAAPLHGGWVCYSDVLTCTLPTPLLVRPMNFSIDRICLCRRAAIAGRQYSRYRSLSLSTEPPRFQDLRPRRLQQPSGFQASFFSSRYHCQHFRQ